MANELREQTFPVEPVDLHMAKPPAHLDTGIRLDPAHRGPKR
jgi:hypothetical protein